MLLCRCCCTVLQALNAASSHAALACQGSELGIWDLQTQQRSYHAKGGKPNMLRLVDKPHNTAVAFLPGSDSQRLVVGTAYHKLRIYDVKSRRPTLNMDFGEARVTAVAPQTDGEPNALYNCPCNQHGFDTEPCVNSRHPCTGLCVTMSCRLNKAFSMRFMSCTCWALRAAS